MATHLDQRFLESKRGHIVELLRRSGRTVEELARARDLTSNGIRSHLAVLERDGIVRQHGSVRRSSGGRKPAYVYELVPDAEGMFPKEWARVLDFETGLPSAVEELLANPPLPVDHGYGATTLAIIGYQAHHANE